MKRRPKQSNPRAKLPPSRHEKMLCPYCLKYFSKKSMTAHYQVSHPETEPEEGVSE